MRHHQRPPLALQRLQHQRRVHRPRHPGSAGSLELHAGPASPVKDQQIDLGSAVGRPSSGKSKAQLLICPVEIVLCSPFPPLWAESGGQLGWGGRLPPLRPASGCLAFAVGGRLLKHRDLRDVQAPLPRRQQSYRVHTAQDHRTGGTPARVNSLGLNLEEATRCPSRTGTGGQTS